MLPRDLLLIALASLTLVFTLPPVLSAQSSRTARTVWASDPSEVPAMAREVDLMLDSGRLQVARIQADSYFPGRHHERLNQYHRGVRVFGAQLVWQKQAGLIISITGKIYDSVNVDTTPTLTASRAEAHALASEPPGTRVVGDTELVVLPLGESYSLAYYMRLRGAGTLQAVFIDAHSGTRLLEWNDLHTQHEGVGLGIGTWGDRKKMTSEQAAGTYRAVDMIRPFGIKTYDVNFNYNAWNSFKTETDSFLATDSDNKWHDGAVVDAHVYSGYTYDYYFKRHGRRGLDDKGRVAINYVHIIPQRNGINNAFYYFRDNSVNYYDGDGVEETFQSAALDVVAHEITHGVTEFSSKLIYYHEPGALNEAISDIIGVAVEFFFEPIGSGRLQADWGLFEDLRIKFGSYSRSFSNPRSVGPYYRDQYYPDHYSVRFRGDFDNRGVHINSSIVNHAFYLMVMGGTNRVSGIRVNGIGFDRMSHMERIFYRAFMFYLVPISYFSDAREATIRSARELYGEGSVEEQTVRQGWKAVGVQ